MPRICTTLKGINMSDKEIYQLIADELKSKNIDAALWTQAKETALGDLDRTEAIYIRLRFFELMKSATPPSQSTALIRVSEVKTDADDLSKVRTELAKKLLDESKCSLYSILRLHPDASDVIIAASIRDLESGNLESSGVSLAEFKYAKETLTDAQSRERYDRQLLASLPGNAFKPYQSYAATGANMDDSWWDSSKTSVIIGVLLLVMVGYLGVNYLKVKNASDIQKVIVESQKEVLHTISDTEKMRVQADFGERAENFRLVAERQNQEMELRNQAAERMHDEQRRAQEERMQAQQQQSQAQKEQAEKLQKTQHEQVEDLRISKEKQYWACMNLQLSQSNITGYEASAKCAMYR